MFPGQLPREWESQSQRRDGFDRLPLPEGRSLPRRSSFRTWWHEPCLNTMSAGNLKPLASCFTDNLELQTMELTASGSQDSATEIESNPSIAKTAISQGAEHFFPE